MTNNKTPSRQEMIDAIYEKIADKTLSFGCRIMLENQEIILENEPYEGNYSEYYEANGVITGRYGTETTEGTTLQIEKIDFYEKFYNEKEVSDAFAEEFVFDEEYETDNRNLTIIGHPVMIGDAMDLIEKNAESDTIREIRGEGINTIKIGCTQEKKIEILNYNLLFFWKDKRKPIEEQSKECIDFIYNLIP